jgi:hypothetical protein
LGALGTGLGVGGDGAVEALLGAGAVGAGVEVVGVVAVASLEAGEGLPVDGGGGS